MNFLNSLNSDAQKLPDGKYIISHPLHTQTKCGDATNRWEGDGGAVRGFWQVPQPKYTTYRLFFLTVYGMEQNREYPWSTIPPTGPCSLPLGGSRTKRKGWGGRQRSEPNNAFAPLVLTWDFRLWRRWWPHAGNFSHRFGESPYESINFYTGTLNICYAP